MRKYVFNVKAENLENGDVKTFRARWDEDGDLILENDLILVNRHLYGKDKRRLRDSLELKPTKWRIKSILVDPKLVKSLVPDTR